MPIATVHAEPATCTDTAVRSEDVCVGSVKGGVKDIRVTPIATWYWMRTERASAPQKKDDRKPSPTVVFDAALLAKVTSDWLKA